MRIDLMKRHVNEQHSHIAYGLREQRHKVVTKMQSIAIGTVFSRKDQRRWQRLDKLQRGLQDRIQAVEADAKQNKTRLSQAVLP